MFLIKYREKKSLQKFEVKYIFPEITTALKDF